MSVRQRPSAPRDNRRRSVFKTHLNAMPTGADNAIEFDESKINAKLDELYKTQDLLFESQKKKFSQNYDKYLSAITLLNKIEPDFQYLNQTIQRHNQMVNFLIESCVNDELKKKILAKKIEKVVKIEDALSDVRKIPGPVFSALRESAYKLKGIVRVLDSNTHAFISNVQLIFFSTHLMINEEIKSSISNTANDQTVVYQFKELLPHSICNLVQIRDTDSVKNIFEVISQKSDYIFQAESSYSKSRWLNLFEEFGMIKGKNRRQRFDNVLERKTKLVQKDAYSFEQYQTLLDCPKYIKALIIKRDFPKAVEKILEFKKDFDRSQTPDEYGQIFIQIEQLEADIFKEIKDVFDTDVITAIRQNEEIKVTYLKCLIRLGRLNEARDIFFTEQNEIIIYTLRQFLLNKKPNEFVFNISKIMVEKLVYSCEFFISLFDNSQFCYLCEFVENMMKTFLSMHRKHIFRNSIKLPMTSEAVKCLFESCKKLEDIGIPLMYILKDSLVRDIDDIINSSYNRLIYWIGSIESGKVPWDSYNDDYTDHIEYSKALTAKDVPQSVCDYENISPILLEFLNLLYSFRKDSAVLNVFSSANLLYKAINNLLKKFLQILNHKSAQMDLKEDIDFFSQVIVPENEKFLSLSLDLATEFDLTQYYVRYIGEERVITTYLRKRGNARNPVRVDARRQPLDKATESVSSKSPAQPNTQSISPEKAPETKSNVPPLRKRASTRSPTTRPDINDQSAKIPEAYSGATMRKRRTSRSPSRLNPRDQLAEKVPETNAIAPRPRKRASTRSRSPVQPKDGDQILETNAVAPRPRRRASTRSRSPVQPKNDDQPADQIPETNSGIPPRRRRTSKSPSRPNLQDQPAENAPETSSGVTMRRKNRTGSQSAKKDPET